MVINQPYPLVPLGYQPVEEVCPRHKNVQPQGSVLHPILTDFLSLSWNSLPRPLIHRLQATYEMLLLAGSYCTSGHAVYDATIARKWVGLDHAGAVRMRTSIQL